MLDDLVKNKNNTFRNLLGTKLVRLLVTQKMTQADIASVLKMNQPRVSVLLSGNFEEFRIDTLINYLLRMGANITITVD